MWIPQMFLRPCPMNRNFLVLWRCLHSTRRHKAECSYRHNGRTSAAWAGRAAEERSGGREGHLDLAAGGQEPADHPPPVLHQHPSAPSRHLLGVRRRKRRGAISICGHAWVQQRGPNSWMTVVAESCGGGDAPHLKSPGPWQDRMRHLRKRAGGECSRIGRWVGSGLDRLGAVDEQCRDMIEKIYSLMRAEWIERDDGC